MSHRMIFRAMLVLPAWLGLSALGTAADHPTISNRPPKPGEVGYRPGDGQTVRLNPPSFIWLHEKDAATYEIQWATQPDFANAETARGFVWNTYTHHTPLASGEYVWRVPLHDAGRPAIRLEHRPQSRGSGGRLADHLRLPRSARQQVPLPVGAQHRGTQRRAGQRRGADQTHAGPARPDRR